VLKTLCSIDRGVAVLDDQFPMNDDEFQFSMTSSVAVAEPLLLCPVATFAQPSTGLLIYLL
jgi:hypothetical protein